jgi:lysophospholipase L1-like esterase
MVAMAVAVGTFAATVGAEPLLTGETGQLADAGPPPTVARRAPLKVLVVGDSQGATLAQGPGIEGGQHGLAVQPGVVVWNRALLGCPISSRPTFVIDGEAQHNKCGGDGVWQRQWPADVAAFQPDVVVVAAGAWDLYDVQLDDGRVVAPGADPVWATGYEHDVVQMFDDLQASGAPVIALVPSCYGDNTVTGAEAAPSERRDANRIHAVKRVWAAAAKVTGATMAPLDGMLCPGGTADATIRPDGAHYDGAGADRIAPAVMATARAALVRSGGEAQSSLRTPRNPNHASSATHPAS